MSADFLDEHRDLTRRYFLGLGGAGIAALSLQPGYLRAGEAEDQQKSLNDRIGELEYLTKQEEFQDVSRGKPVPHSLSPERRKEVGLTRDTWQLEVTSDPEHPARLRREFSKKDDTAFTWKHLMELAKTKAVSFPKVMTCNNIGCPLGMGIWEGVPLREVVWKLEPRSDLRRLHYYGFHNENPKQMFRSSLSIGRVLEDPFGLPPVILCYKLNGQFLNPERGGPVRMVVPEAYGFKSIKWLKHIVLSNRWRSNDTYGERNNDVDSLLKTFAATIAIPVAVKPETEFPVTGWAQVGAAGLSKVQYWLHPEGQELPAGDRYFEKAPWKDAKILAAPTSWGGSLPENKIPQGTLGFKDGSNRPQNWPMRLTKAHWAILVQGVKPGNYDFRCRTIDANGRAQPMPRPFDKSGRTSIERKRIQVKA